MQLRLGSIFVFLAILGVACALFEQMTWDSLHSNRWTTRILPNELVVSGADLGAWLREEGFRSATSSERAEVTRFFGRDHPLDQTFRGSYLGSAPFFVGFRFDRPPKSDCYGIRFQLATKCRTRTWTAQRTLRQMAAFQDAFNRFCDRQQQEEDGES